MKRLITISLLFFSVCAFAQTSVPTYELLTVSGTDTYTVTSTPSPGSYVNGYKKAVKFTNANTGVSTINFNSIGAITLRKSDGSALSLGDIAAGSVWWVIYDGTASQFRLTGGSGSSYIFTNGLTESGGTVKMKGRFQFSETAPDTAVAWVDTANGKNQAYPIRRYVNGSWTDVDDNSEWWDTIGEVISNGSPLVIGYSGQSNAGTSFYFPMTLQYGASYTGDVSVDPRVTVWSSWNSRWEVYDFYNQYSGGPWNLNHGVNQLQKLGKLIAKSGRSVRFVGSRAGGTSANSWEAGGASWIILKDNIEDSGVDKLDTFIWIHGEGGLGSSGFTTYTGFLYDFIDRLRHESWSDRNMKFIATSNGDGHYNTIISASENTTAAAAEKAARSLSSSENPYNDWSPLNYTRVLQQHEGAYNTTSSTSVNLSSLTTTATITIPAGLTAGYPVTAVNAVFVSRSNPAQYCIGNIQSYNNGSGVLVLDNIKVYGTGTFSDWDVSPQDKLHLTTIEQEWSGESLYQVWSKLPNLKKKDTPIKYFYKPDSTGRILQMIGVYPQSDDVQLNWTSATVGTSGASAFKMGFSAGAGSSPNAYIVAKQTSNTDGTSTQADIEIWNSGTGDGGVTRNLRFASDGSYSYKNLLLAGSGAAGTAEPTSALFFGSSNGGGTGNDIWIGRSNDNYGIVYKSGSSGAAIANHKFYLGNFLGAEINEFGGVAGSPSNVVLNNLDLIQKNATDKVISATNVNSALTSASLAASTSVTAVVIKNSNNNIIVPNDSFIEVELKVVGVKTSATVADEGFTATRKGIFKKVSTTLTYVGAGPLSIDETSFDLVDWTNGITFSISSGVISATFLRGSTAGNFKISSVVNYTVKSN